MPNDLDLSTLLLIAVWMVIMCGLFWWALDYLNSEDD